MMGPPTPVFVTEKFSREDWRFSSARVEWSITVECYVCILLVSGMLGPIVAAAVDIFPLSASAPIVELVIFSKYWLFLTRAIDPKVELPEEI